MIALGKSGEDAPEEKASQLNALFSERIVPFYRDVIQMTLTAQFDELLVDFKAQEQNLRNQKADLIKQKFEVITREYDQQNKNFELKHRQIASDEEKRLKEI